MAAGLIARKMGMTQIFLDDGQVAGVTVLFIEPCRVVSHRKHDIDGYEAIQVGYGTGKKKGVSRAEQGHFSNNNIDLMTGLKEFRVEDSSKFACGTELLADMFSVGQKIDVSGVSKGHGFAGVMKRYNFAGGRASHGNEKTHRQMGSTGQCQDPGRVFKNKKMPGHYGNERVTIQSLEVVRVDLEENRLLVRGAVPGAKGGLIEVRPAVKVGKGA
ncbi:MAG: 50S ribosomal protein L3 [Mariprofundales bacterium]